MCWSSRLNKTGFSGIGVEMDSPRRTRRARRKQDLPVRSTKDFRSSDLWVTARRLYFPVLRGARGFGLQISETFVSFVSFVVKEKKGDRTGLPTQNPEERQHLTRLAVLRGDDEKDILHQANNIMRQ